MTRDWLHSWKRSAMACNLHLSASPPLACQKIPIEKGQPGTYFCLPVTPWYYYHRHSL